MKIVSIKVLAEAEDDRAIWSVDVQTDFGPSRLCGAWINPGPEDLANLLTRQPVLMIGAAEVRSELDCNLVDVSATRQAVVDEFERLSEVNRASRTEKGNKRAPLIRPEIPEVPPAFDAAGEAPRGFINPSPAAIAAVRAAHYLAALAGSWAKIETLRLGRDYLRGDTVDPRQFPVVTKCAE